MVQAYAAAAPFARDTYMPRLAAVEERGVVEAATADEIDEHVGRRLRARRMELRLSQGALGRHLGLTFSQVQKYEKGLNRIGAGRLYRLADLLGVPVAYFYQGLGPAEAEARVAAQSADERRMHDAFAKITDPQAREALVSLASSMVDKA